MNEVKHDRVALAMSGGRDSTAAAILLKREGFDVLAITMLLPSQGTMGDEVTERAGAIASALDLEHRILDIRFDFERLVIQPFIKAYAEGLTPNPCVVCNRKIKFGILLEEAKSSNCAFLATGHYARTVGGKESGFKITRAKDRDRDQSYILWTLDQATLERSLFPLGEKTRVEVEKLVAQAGLQSQVLPESQDICFLSGLSYHTLFVNRARSGPILDRDGNVIGTHRGLPFYTVGQRHGLDIGTDRALYVLELRPEDNSLVVGDKKYTVSSEFYIEGMNFISGEAETGTVSCEVSTRYRGPSCPADLDILGGGRALVRYRHLGPSAAPGQSAAFYRGDELLGGGYITRRNRL